MSATACELELVVESEEGLAAALDDAQMHDLALATLAARGVRRPCSLSVSIVGDERIRELNRAWRGVYRATDVISVECERPDDPDLGEGEVCELGDVVLAPRFLARQAASMGSTEADEWRLMLVHGVLHLLGMDHLEEADARAMRAAEEAVLASVPTDGTLTDVVLTRHREEEA